MEVGDILRLFVIVSGVFMVVRAILSLAKRKMAAFKVNMYINTFFYTSVSRKGVRRYYFRRRLSANVG